MREDKYMDKQKEKRIAVALERITWWQAGLQLVPYLPAVREQLLRLLTALSAEIVLAPNRETIHAMITATKHDLYKKTANTKELTDEQKEYFGKEIDLITDGIEHGIEGILFIDWSNLQK